MPPIPPTPAVAMKTLGSYNLASIARNRKKKHKKDKEKKERKKRKVTVKTKVGRPSLATKKEGHRSRYTPEDMQETVDLVKTTVTVWQGQQWPATFHGSPCLTA
jgi:hypothetical protein